MDVTAPGSPRPTALEPPVAGSRVFLRPILTQDYELILAAEMSAQTISSYRNRGATPSPAEFAVRLWQGVLAQFLACRSDNAEPIAVVTAYGADFRNGHAYLAHMMFPKFAGKGWPQEGIELFISYLFKTFSFRKLYGETNSALSTAFGSVGRGVFREEARLVGHEVIDGQYVDKIIYAVYANDWESRRQKSGERSKLAERVRQAAGGDATRSDL